MNPEVAQLLKKFQEDMAIADITDRALTKCEEYWSSLNNLARELESASDSRDATRKVQEKFRKCARNGLRFAKVAGSADFVRRFNVTFSTVDRVLRT